MSAPLSVRAVPLHARLVSGATTTEHVLVQTVATTEVTGPRPRLTAVLVVDVSGSMQGEPLAQVVKSAQLLAEILPEGSSLGVVAFASEARTVSPVRKLDAASRAEIMREVATLRAGGNTNMSAGLSRGALLLPARASDERQLLLLLTDGQANEGVATKEGLAREVGVIRQRGVAVSTLGYGSAHNEDLLVAIANAGGGRYSFVSDPLLARSSFVRALGAQLDVVAEEVKLLVQPEGGVEVVRVLGGPPVSFGAQGLTIKLQDAIAGEKASVVLELRVEAPAHDGLHHLAELTLSGKAAGGEPFALGALATVELAAAGSDPDPTVVSLVAIARADELREGARARGDVRDFAGAIGLCEQALAILEKAPRDAAVTDAIGAIQDDLVAYRRVPTTEEFETFKKAQRDYGDFASGSKAMTNRFGVTEGTVRMTELMARETLPPARLVFVRDDGKPANGQVFALGRDATVGRSADAEISLPQAASISRQHARVVYAEGDYWLFDLGSTNATCVNGQKVQRHRLAPGDVIRLGAVELRFDQAGRRSP
ncbi:MAG TPA: VWA domain-containing protein [Planctomycetota bacterium]|nr:VWA domain-containing protein [Planctomycetota bacterium]